VPTPENRSGSRDGSRGGTRPQPPHCQRLVTPSSAAVGYIVPCWSSPLET
jgi:hypothetical protein